MNSKEAGDLAFRTGTALYRKKEYAKATEYFKLADAHYTYIAQNEAVSLPNAIAAKENLCLAYNQVGHQYFISGDFPQAILAFRKAVQADGNDFQANLNLGRAYHRAKDIANAANAFQEAKKLKSSDFSAFYHFGECQLTLKKYVEAIKIFQESINKTSDVANKLRAHCKIIESAQQMQDESILNSAIEKAYKEISNVASNDLLDHVPVANYILVHYGKLCLSASGNATDIPNVCKLYADINQQSGKVLHKALIKFIYHDYHHNHSLTKAEKMLGTLVKYHNINPVTFKDVLEASIAIASEDLPGSQSLVDSITMADTPEALSIVLMGVP